MAGVGRLDMQTIAHMVVVRKLQLADGEQEIQHLQL